MPTRFYQRLPFYGVCTLLASLCCLVVLQACETPVYRYAMYRWKPAPYEIYYFHSEPLSSATQTLHERIAKLALLKPDQPMLNATLITVDLSKDPQLQKVLPDIKQLWTQHQDQLSPGYLVTNPQGGAVSIGTLAEDQLTALTTSAKRQQLLKQLSDGKAAILVLLTSKDTAANQAAEKQVRSLVEAVNQGKVGLYQVPDEPAEQDATKEQPTAKPSHTLGWLTVDRQDPQEKWLVQSLLAVESDLQDLQEPMVFAVYGRARALPPYVGKGITRENLLQCVEFVTGACSCTVKEQNPGVDLLVQSDWETIAARIADKFGAEEGNETQFGGDDFFPELIIGSGGSLVTDAATEIDLRIYCDNELRHPVGEIVRQYETQHDVSIAVNYGTSSDLLAQLELDKTGDIYLAGGSSYFQQANQKGLTEISIPLAKRKPVIAVARDNTSIKGITDLLDPQVNVALGTPEEAAIGSTTRQLLTASGHWKELAEHVTEHGLFEASVDDIMDAIKQGRVTAGIIWDTAGASDAELKLVPVPELDAGESSIEIAVLNSSKVTPAAQQFTQFVASPQKGLAIFKEKGFRLVAADVVATADVDKTTLPNQAPAANATADQLPHEASMPSTIWIVGIGILGGLALLFGITLFVIRPR
ncbi:MAG: molybdate ABC transporter substrate-binding protein [Pirellulaceae bacterium]